MKLTWNTVLYGALGTMTLLHLLVFTKYPFDPYPNTTTLVGEALKTCVPLGMLVALIPAVHKLSDTIVHRPAVNVLGLVLAAFFVVNQIVNTPGQAWSTLAFSTLLILVLYNHINSTHDLGNTLSLVLSFMAVWTGWLVFEMIFQIGVWCYHPDTFDSISAFLMTLRTVIMWMIPPAVFVEFLLLRSKVSIQPMKLSLVLATVGVAATFVWFSTGMLVPILIGPDGLPYRIDIYYFTLEHLQFTVSRLSQISIMGVSVTLFASND